MSQITKSLLILLGTQFDEPLVILLRSDLWDIGWLVKLVGATTHATRGKRDMPLLPDISLERAVELPIKVAGILIPCSVPYLDFLRDEPRYATLLRKVTSERTRFIVASAEAGVAVQHLFRLPGHVIVVMAGDRCEGVAQIVQQLQTLDP